MASIASIRDQILSVLNDELSVKDNGKELLQQKIVSVVPNASMSDKIICSLKDEFPLLYTVNKYLMIDIDKVQMQQILSTPEGMPEKIKESIDQIHFTDPKYNDFVQNIISQYEAFNNMMMEIKMEPQKAMQHKEKFKNNYKKQNSSQQLTTFIEDIKREPSELLKDYMKTNTSVQMEDMFKYLELLIYRGIVVEMAIIAVLNELEFMKEWGERFIEIQTKFQYTLNMCE
ncbi:rapunzel 2 [Silurus meridionalis]|nr:rapunzel 2 [Silurus meridionalis]